jgi:catechol 2,3-dioxygenase-like lactoylglutathione lyase family enzyme
LATPYHLEVGICSRVSLQRPAGAGCETAKECVVFDHLGIGVSNYEECKSFFLAALAPLGVKTVMEGPFGLGIGSGGKPSFWMHQVTGKPLPLHLAFAAENHAQVDAFYHAALAAGGKDNGPPGLRPHYHVNYYGAFVTGPDGHNVEAVCHKPEA